MSPSYHGVNIPQVLPGYRAATRVRFATAQANWRVKGTAAPALEQAYLRIGG